MTRGVTSLADALRALAGRRLTDADGETHALELLPPASAEELRVLESKLPGPLPAVLPPASRPGFLRRLFGASS